jgi:hypothetical protein
MIDSEKKPDDKQEDNTDKPSLVKQHALPLSVIVMSWISGIIACGVTCSFATSPASMLLNHPSSKVRIAAWAWALLAILLSVYVGLHVGKDARKRYRKDKA